MVSLEKGDIEIDVIKEYSCESLPQNDHNLVIAYFLLTHGFMFLCFKSSRMMISKLVGQVTTDTSQESRDIRRAIDQTGQQLSDKRPKDTPLIR